MEELSPKPSRIPKSNVQSGATKKERFLKQRISYRDLDNDVKAIHRELNIRKGQTPRTVVDRYDAQKVGVEKQLDDNDKAVAQLLRDGTEIITNIRVANDKREVDRRNKEAELREELLQKLQQESQEANIKFENITARWKELDQLRDPMGIYEGLEFQKKRIDDLMAQKDAVIEECRKELDQADMRYVFDQEKQAADIHCLIERIDSQINIIKMAYRHRLDLLDDAIDTERDLIRTDHVAKFNEFQKFREIDENEKSANEKERPEYYAAEIARITEEHEECIRATRIRLEQDNEQLQVELENLKGNVILNSDKFDYNFQVLQKREEENIIIRNQQKRRMTRLNESVNNYKKRIHDLKRNSEMEISKLSIDIKAWRKKILDLEEKADSMSKINDNKYHKIWKMNQKEACKLLEKVLAIDKVIYDQQLGIKWEMPNMVITGKEDLQSYKDAEKKLSQLFQSQVKPTESMTTQSNNVISKPSQHIVHLNENTQMMRTIFRSIADNSGFLVETKLNSLLQPYSETDQTLVRIDNVFYALGIKRIEDVLLLQDYFAAYAFCPNCYKTYLLDSPEVRRSSTPKPSTSLEGTHQTILPSDEYLLPGDSDSVTEIIASMKKQNADISVPEQEGKLSKSDQVPINSCQNHYYVIDWGSVLTALRDYVEVHIATKRAIPVTTMSSHGTKKSISRLLANDDVQYFWDQYLKIIPREKEKLWNTFEHGLTRYIEELKKRKQLCNECDDLKRQNNELKFLMQRYMPWKSELEEIIDTAGIDSELWVSMLAENMKTLPATGSLNTEITDYEETRPIFMDMVNDLRKLVTKHSDLGMLPLECQYLNKAALTSMVGQQPAPQKHFTLKRKPKSTALRAELLQKSCDAQSTLKKVSAPTIPLRSRGMPRKMTDTTPLKGIPSRVPTSGFRSPPSLQTQNRPNFSRIPAGRKEGGVKLLDITEQPLGYAAAKKRKRQQELEEQQKKIETQATNNNNNPSSTNNNASSPTSTPTATTPTTVPSTTPDYAAGLTATSVYTQPSTPAPSTTSKLLERPTSPSPFTLNPTTSITSTTVTTPTVTSTPVIKIEPNALLSPSSNDDEPQPPLISIIKTEPSILQEPTIYIKAEPNVSIVASTPITSSIITTTTSPFTSLPSNVIIQQHPPSSVPSIVSSSIATSSIQSPTINKILINTNKPQINNSISNSSLSSSQLSNLISATTTIPSSTIVKTIPSSLQQIQTTLSGIQTILTSPPTHQQTTNNIIHIPRQTTIKQIPKPQTTTLVSSLHQQHQLHQQPISQPSKIVQIKTQPTIVVSSSNSISHQNIPPLISTQVPLSNKINITNIQNVNIPLNKIQMDSTNSTKTNIIRLAGPRPMTTTTTATTATALIQQQIQQQQQQKMGQIMVQSPAGMNVKGKTIILANPNQLASKGVIIRSVGPVGNTVYQQIPFSNFINSGPPGLIKTEPGTGGGTTQVMQQNQNNNQQLPALVPTSQFQTMPSLTPVMITSSNLQQQQQAMPALLTTGGSGGDQTQKTAIVRPVQMQGVNVLPQGLTLIQRPGQQPRLVQVSNQPTLQRTIITQQSQHGDGQQQQTTIRPQTIFVPQSQIQQQPQMQQQNITNQNPQTNRKGLSLKHKHYVEAQAIFQNANVVTRVEKAVILGFMAGFRENPKPSPENTIVIKLGDTKQKILQENGSYVITSEKSFIKLDYNTGEWKTFKETTILEQHHEEQNSIENSVAIN